MIAKLENSMIRELSDDELLVVSGAKPMEAEAGRYTAVDWGPIGWAHGANGDWAFRVGSDYGVAWSSVGGKIQSKTFF